MNRRITLLGVLVALFTVVLIASPIFLTGVEQFDWEQELGILLLPAGLLVVLLGASSPDPSVTTVSGMFGNPDENVLRHSSSTSRAPIRARYLPSPRESVNCRHCYTAVPADLLDCPRCARRRDCRSCGRPLLEAGGAVRCLACDRLEVYCSCPRGRAGSATQPMIRARSH